MTLNELIIDKSKELPKSVPIRELEDLICYCTGKSWSDLQITKQNSQLEGDGLKRFFSLFERLINGEPLAYILGEKDFYKFKFKVNSHVLIPRPETEILVEKALEEIQQKESVVFDIGAGSGCIGLSVAKEAPQAKVFLFEASEKALEVCQENRRWLGVGNVECIQGKVGEEPVEVPLNAEEVDLILANPPYIKHGDSRVGARVSQYEPHQALYATDNGLFWIHKWLIWGYDYLKTGGVLFLNLVRGKKMKFFR